MRAKLVPLAILMSTTMCGGFFAAQAHAETIRPQGNWAVSKVAAKQPGAMPYCALARRFGNGSVLTFARNGADETSLAVDLPKSALTPTKNYTITFDPGEGESRSYDAQPVSERGIVIRMGRDERFYDALEKTGQLAINVSGESYVFSMPDVKNGTQDLAACLGTQVEPAAGDNAPLEARMSDDLNADLLAAEENVIAPATKITAQQKNVKAQKTVTVKAAPPALTPEPVKEIVAAAPVAMVDNSALQSLQEENIRLKNALERERRVYEDKMQQSDNASAAAELNEKLRLLEMENRNLREQAGNAVVAAAPVAPASCTPDQKNQDEIAALKDENNRLKMDLQARQDQIAALEAAQKSTASDQARAGGDVLALEKRAGDAELQLAGLRDQIARLQAENNTLKNTVSATKVSATSSAEELKGNVATITKLKALEVQLGDVQAERDRLSKELAGIKNADADGRVKISSDNWNLEQATRRFNEAELEIRRLGSTLEQERAKCAVEKKDLEYMLFDPKIAEKQQIAKLISLEEELAEANQALKQAESGDKAKLAAFETRVKDLESRIAAENGKVAAAENRAGALEQKVTQLSALEQKLAARENEMAGLRQKLEAAERSSVAAAEQSASAERLKQEIASLNAQISTLQAENTAQKNAADKEQLAMTDTLKQEISRLNGQIATLQAEGAARKDVANKEQTAMINALKQEVASLNGQVANLQTEKSGIAEKLAQISTSAGGNGNSRMAAAPHTVSKAPVEVARADYNAVAVGHPIPVTAQALESSVPVAASMPAGTVSSAPVPALAAAASPANPKMMKQSDMEAVLQRAGIAVSGPVQPVALSGEAGRVAYRWETEGLFGTAEQKTIQSSAQFDSYVSEYLNKTKSRCTGQFASVPALDEVTGPNRLAAYEIACVDDSGAGASAALVFESQNGIFTTIAHEASPESMDVAMDARDKLVSALQNGQTASR